MHDFSPRNVPEKLAPRPRRPSSPPSRLLRLSLSRTWSRQACSTLGTEVGGTTFPCTVLLGNSMCVCMLGISKQSGQYILTLCTNLVSDIKIKSCCPILFQYIVLQSSLKSAQIYMFASIQLELARPRLSLVAMSRQLWLGNIPTYLDEEEAVAELALHKIRVQKLVVRPCRGRPDGDSL